MSLEWTVISDNLDYLLWGRAAEGDVGGLVLTVLMALAAGVLALLAGTALAAVSWRWPHRVRPSLVTAAELIRSIPLIFVIFWLYFLLPHWLGRDVPGTLTVILSLAWFSSAAVMHSTLAAIEALPHGQTEAALACGLSHSQALRWVLVPQALKNLAPSWLGIFISLIKDTSLAFMVNVTELTTVASQVNARTQIYPTEIFLFIGAVYFVLCYGFGRIAQRLIAGQGTPS